VTTTQELGLFDPLEEWFPEYDRLWRAIRESKIAPSIRRGIVIHHTAGGTGSDSLGYARSVCRMHWNQLGSSGQPWRRPGGYQEQIGLDGISREMSGLGYRGIHSGTYESNRDYIAISFQGNYSDRLPTDEMLHTAVLRVAEITAELNWYGAGPLYTGHRDHSTTSCPGERLYSGVPEVILPGEAVTWPNSIHPGDQDEAIAVMKGLLIATGFPTRGERYGRRVQRRVKQFQESTGLTADGVVGPLTQEALTRAVLGVLPS